MEMQWCWRCGDDVPMLDETEFREISDLYRECMRATKDFRIANDLPLEKCSMDQRFSPVVKQYEKMTGYRIGNHNAVMHHRLSLYGPPCPNCGKLLRTVKASKCMECGKQYGR